MGLLSSSGTKPKYFQTFEVVFLLATGSTGSSCSHLSESLLLVADKAKTLLLEVKLSDNDLAHGNAILIYDKIFTIVIR